MRANNVVVLDVAKAIGELISVVVQMEDVPPGVAAVHDLHHLDDPVDALVAPLIGKSIALMLVRGDVPTIQGCSRFLLAVNDWRGSLPHEVVAAGKQIARVFSLVNIPNVASRWADEPQECERDLLRVFRPSEQEAYDRLQEARRREEEAHKLLAEAGNARLAAQAAWVEAVRVCGLTEAREGKEEHVVQRPLRSYPLG